MICSSVKSEEFILTCHTSTGDINDEHGRFFVAGNKYKMKTEPRGISIDSKGSEAILCWVSYNENFGSRFAIKGNIYHPTEGEGCGYWPHFTKYFIDPLSEKRSNKLKSIGI